MDDSKVVTSLKHLQWYLFMKATLLELTSLLTNGLVGQRFIFSAVITANITLGREAIYESCKFQGLSATCELLTF